MLTKEQARERARRLLLKLAEDAASLGHVPVEKHAEAAAFVNKMIDQAYPEPQLSLLHGSFEDTPAAPCPECGTPCIVHAEGHADRSPKYVPITARNG